MYEVKGKVVMVGDTIQVSEKFSKREFVISDESGLYPQSILFQLSKDNCILVDNVRVGDEVSVSFNLNGREWTNPQGEVKYFNTLSAWKVVKQSGSALNSDVGNFEAKPLPNPVVNVIDMPDDLPF